MRHRVVLSLQAASFAAAIIGLTRIAHAQPLESRVANARGSVAFEYETRPSVCGDGTSITVSNDSSSGWALRSSRLGVHISTSDGNASERCDTGPARVVLRRDGSQVTDLQVTVGGRLEKADTDLGDVPPADAARYLLSVAPQLSGRAGDQAVMGAEIAEGIVVWPRLLRIARDDNASESSRKAAAFWVSQEASVTATAGLDSLASDDAATVSIRSDALFYLARRPNAEGIPALIRVAETSKSAKLRKDAIWYLGQSQDSRALALFEKILSGR